MERVYHYTSMDAFLCLLESIKKSSDKKSLVFRATNIFFMNDPQEFIYGQEILMEVLKEIEYEKQVDYDLQLSSIFKKNIKEEEWLVKLRESIHKNNESPYVISFSHNSDSLPMWLNYGDDGNGVCLAFTEYRSRIKKGTSKLKDLDIAQVEIYDMLGTHDVYYNADSLKNKDNRLRKLIEYLYDYYLNKIKSISSEELLRLRIDCLRAFTEVTAPYIKTKEYESENEVRLAKTVKGDKNNDINEIKFRCNAKGHIIPFIDVEIPTKKLDYVRIGPLVNKELTSKGLEMIKKKYKLDFEIRESAVKYRNY